MTPEKRMILLRYRKDMIELADSLGSTCPPYIADSCFERLVSNLKGKVVETSEFEGRWRKMVEEAVKRDTEGGQRDGKQNPHD